MPAFIAALKAICSATAGRRRWLAPTLLHLACDNLQPSGLGAKNGQEPAF